jgi:hypothetical protein
MKLMPKRTMVLVGLIAVFATGACGRGLDRDEAKRIVQDSPLIRPTDNVAVEAMSALNDAETVVRTTIAGKPTNLKFRRFDTGWKWEFVETNSGGWIAPEVAISQIREEQRAVAAAKWAAENAAPYAATAKTMYYVSLYHVPNPSELANFEMWKKLTAGIVDMAKRRPDMQDRLPVLTADRWSDAWGSDIAARYDGKDGSTVLVSFGPDKIQGNEDDLICLNTFRRDYEDGRMVWQHTARSMPAQAPAP